VCSLPGRIWLQFTGKSCFRNFHGSGWCKSGGCGSISDGHRFLFMGEPHSRFRKCRRDGGPSNCSRYRFSVGCDSSRLCPCCLLELQSNDSKNHLRVHQSAPSWVIWKSSICCPIPDLSGRWDASCHQRNLNRHRPTRRFSIRHPRSECSSWSDQFGHLDIAQCYPPCSGKM
jgi:hypothetical protein